MIQPFSPHGHYEVGRQIYYNKFEAAYRASQQKQSLYWNFHDQAYGKLDWTQRPSGSLDELYRLRAQQLRDKYDYLIVNFSGGMDSWTVLDSFLRNNIKIDEIYTRWALAERNYKAANNTVTDSINFTSEFEYAVLPVLEKIKIQYPDINIVIDDFSDAIQAPLSENDYFASNAYQSMLSFFRFNRKSVFEMKLNDSVKIGVVHGYDKIKCGIDGRDFFAYFTDSLGGKWDESRNIEFFYWTPDFPMIPIMQAHLILEFLEQHADRLPILIGQNNFSQYYKNIYRSVCCPTFDTSTFQTEKPIGSMVWKTDDWIVKYNPEYYQSWRWHNKQFLDGISDRFISTKHTVKLGLKKCVSKAYIIKRDIDIRLGILPDLAQILV